MKKSALAAINAAAAGMQAEVTKPQIKRPAKAATTEKVVSERPDRAGKVLIGGHYSPVVRRALLLAQAQPQNEGRNMRQLLGEAINDLCAKYGVPEPYTGEA
jgi:hypothetical protein